MAYSKDIQRIMRRLETIPSQIIEEARPAILKSGDELVAGMKRLAATSRDTGDLIDSIKATPPGQSTPPYSQPGGATVAGELEVLVTAGNEDVRYPHLVEYGSSQAAAQPFFWPAFNILKTRIKRRNIAAVRKAIRKSWGKP